MSWTEGIKETGTIQLAEKEFPVSRVVTEQKRRFIEIPGRGNIQGDVWELIREDGEIHNPAFVLLEGSWIMGHTFQRRWTSGDGRPERQNIFISDDKTLSFVVSSGRITV